MSTERYRMDDITTIANQSKRIESLSIELSDLKKRIKKAKSHMTSVGGPLNDNKLRYSKDQLVTFRRIMKELNI